MGVVTPRSRRRQSRGVARASTLAVLGLSACGHTHVDMDPFEVGLSVPPPERVQVSATLMLRCRAAQRGLARFIEPVYDATEQDFPLTATVEASDSHRGSRTAQLLTVQLSEPIHLESPFSSSEYARPACYSTITIEVRDPRTGSRSAPLVLENHVAPADGAQHASAYTNALSNGSLDSWYEREPTTATDAGSQDRYSFVLLFSGHGNQANRTRREAVGPLHWCGANGSSQASDPAVIDAMKTDLRDESECQTYHGRLLLR